MFVGRVTVLAAAFSALAFSAQAVSVSLIDSSTQGIGNQAHLFASGYAGNTALLLLGALVGLGVISRQRKAARA